VCNYYAYIPKHPPITLGGSNACAELPAPTGQYLSLCSVKTWAGHEAYLEGGGLGWRFVDFCREICGVLWEIMPSAYSFRILEKRAERTGSFSLVDDIYEPLALFSLSSLFGGSERVLFSQTTDQRLYLRVIWHDFTIQMNLRYEQVIAGICAGG